VTVQELKLFLHRQRLFPDSADRNLARELIAIKFVYPEYFTPTRQFFLSTKIRQRRWWQLYRGEKKITELEYRAVVEHLNITLNEAFEARQLTLFENEIH
jgi:hypothetical protein